MRHFEFLDGGERSRLFQCDPEPFDADDDPSLLGVALGATLYLPATRPTIGTDIVRRAAAGATSVVVCLEDAVADRDLADAERNAVAQLRELGDSGAQRPLVFVRVRHQAQVAMVVDGLGGRLGVLDGFVVPKFTATRGAAFFDAVTAVSQRTGRRLLVMPVLETPELGSADTRVPSLLDSRRLIDAHRDLVPAVRVGATDLSAAFGLRRAREFTVWDVRVVADALAAVVSVFGRVDRGAYVVSGPVWEYFADSERIFRPLLRLTPFAANEERALRAELLAAHLDGLIREVELDRANGMTGKTVIHPSHVAAVHALSVVSPEDYADACDVLAGAGGGAAASSYGNKMNESKPHAAWAERTLTRARVFGVVREGVSFVDLLGAVMHS